MGPCGWEEGKVWGEINVETGNSKGVQAQSTKGIVGREAQGHTRTQGTQHRYKACGVSWAGMGRA